MHRLGTELAVLAEDIAAVCFLPLVIQLSDGIDPGCVLRLEKNLSSETVKSEI